MAASGSHRGLSHSDHAGQVACTTEQVDPTENVSSTYVNYDDKSDSTDCCCVLPFWHGAARPTRLRCKRVLGSGIKRSNVGGIRIYLETKMEKIR